jgi:hypothetical protein
MWFGYTILEAQGKSVRIRRFQTPAPFTVLLTPIGSPWAPSPAVPLPYPQYIFQVLTYSSTLNVETAISSEISLNMYGTSRAYITSSTVNMKDF